MNKYKHESVCTKKLRSNFETTSGLTDDVRREASERKQGSREGATYKVNEQSEMTFRILTQEFDPGSGRTLAACLIHASRTGLETSVSNLVANG